MFNIFKSKKNNLNIEAIVIGFFRDETSKLLGLKHNTKELKDARESAVETLQTTLLLLLDDNILKDISNTLASVSTNRHEEMLGECMILLFVRFCVAQKGIREGILKEEEATADILATALHNQIRAIIKQKK